MVEKSPAGNARDWAEISCQMRKAVEPHERLIAAEKLIAALTRERYFEARSRGAREIQ